ncbi:hypothetical protein LY76DRAFT_76383 [Colletotrichum caudatum]|nr:hypothetical protein LY76DRAFT_76383 [Colletotrichum caudatum]
MTFASRSNPRDETGIRPRGHSDNSQSYTNTLPIAAVVCGGRVFHVASDKPWRSRVSTDAGTAPVTCFCIFGVKLLACRVFSRSAVSQIRLRICIRLVPGAGRLRNRRLTVSRGRKRVASAAAWIAASVSTPESPWARFVGQGRGLCRERLVPGRFEDAGRDVRKR